MKRFPGAVYFLFGFVNLLPIGYVHGEETQDMFEMPLEQALEMRVTSLTKTEQDPFEVPAALFVLTQEDIKRSGVTSIPEVLRLVPGLHVGRLTSHQWAISSRGFNNVYSNKLLVLIDGRTVYSPEFSGVYWNAQDLVLSDIHRIEVIRGPGATVWGANAVNGVINITTKRAKETQGGLASGAVGSEDQGIASVSHGSKVGDSSWLRVYGKAFDRDNSERENGGDSADSWRALQGGFRFDSGSQERDLFTVQGDLYGGDLRSERVFPSLTPPFSEVFPSKDSYGGGNVVGRWTHAFSKRSSIDVQTYFDRYYRNESYANQEVETYDLDFTHRWASSDQNTFVWGAGYRRIEDDVERSHPLGVNAPEELNGRNYSNLFFQDEYHLVPQQVAVMLGSKFEYNDFGGFNFQPGIRVNWTPTNTHTVWTSISRAVRTPSVGERKLVIPGGVIPTDTGLPGLIQGYGNPGFDSEVLYAYELGYRVKYWTDVTFDVSTYYNHYPNIESFEPRQPFPEVGETGPRVVIPFFFDNKRQADVHGVEAVVDWKATPWWRLQAWYSFLNMDISLEESSGDVIFRVGERGNAQNQARVRSLIDLPYGFTFDTAVRYVDTIGSGDNLATSFDVPSYIECDVRLGWQATKTLELELIGQNLLHNNHKEYSDLYIATRDASIERAVLGRVTWRFD